MKQNKTMITRCFATQCVKNRKKKLHIVGKCLRRRNECFFVSCFKHTFLASKQRKSNKVHIVFDEIVIKHHLISN